MFAAVARNERNCLPIVIARLERHFSVRRYNRLLGQVRQHTRIINPRTTDNRYLIMRIFTSFSIFIVIIYYTPNRQENI